MGKQAVINASPLILLSRGNHLDLLKGIADHIVVPSVVEEEISRRGALDRTVTLLKSTNWIHVVPACPIPNAIMEWGLGPGESAVLAYARMTPVTEAIIDDLLGRKCAKVLGIPVRGTLGIVLKAKKDGRISSARVVMEDLIKAGLYLSRSILDAALKRVSE